MSNRSASRPPLAIIAPHPSHGGGVLSSLKIVYEFCDRYFTPKVYCLSFLPDVAMSLRSLRFFSSVRERTYEGMRCVEIGARWARWEPGHYWFTRRMWKRYLEAYRYVFVTGGTPHVAHPAVILNKTFILWLASTYLDDRAHRLAQASFLEKIAHKAQAPFMESIELQVLKKTSVLLPISTYTKKLCESVLEISLDSVKICPVPVEVHPFVEKGSVEQLRIISVGRFTDIRKNFSMLLTVCEMLLKEDARFAFDIVGIYPKNNARALRLSAEFKDRIKFHGFVAQDELDFLYKNAFSAVITSDQEGLGITGLDALSWGVPVVATRCGGVADYVIPGLSGFLVEPNAAREMVESLKVLAFDTDLYDWMRKGAVMTMRSRFSKESVFIKFRWALARAYPELEALFAGIDAQEIKHENSGGGACVPVGNK